MESVSLGIRGMTCASCTARVERALTKVAGVSEATVNLATERASVRFDAQQTGVPALLEAVARAGYDPVTERTSLAVSGMTCASCTARVERSLKRLDGVVDASVNLATERASVTYLPGLLTPADLSAAVTAAGYEAREAAASGERVDRERQAREAEVRALRRDVVLAGALTLPLV
ncbi:MAG: copper ion binding protein, partial [Deinococcales bacterium]|nr:copper ion binding protein [Deinococcales bacterium]